MFNHLNILLIKLKKNGLVNVDIDHDGYFWFNDLFFDHCDKAIPILKKKLSKNNLM